MRDSKKTKILVAARVVFLRYGYKRVGMHDIAEGAGVSRPALYLLFKNKEEIFTAVLLQWIDDTLAAATEQMSVLDRPEQKLLAAFEAWTIAPFVMMQNSPEARELMDGIFDFSQDVLRQGYAMFEATITPVVASLLAPHPARAHLSPAAMAHVLASATRGFKQTATDAADLRLLIEQLLMLSFNLNAGAFRQQDA